MLIHSAEHITHLGRTLKINRISDNPASAEALVLTKKVDSSAKIKTKTRIMTDEIAKALSLRKFLRLSEKTMIKVGSFEISAAETSKDMMKTNIIINSSLYFLTFVPEIFMPFSGEMTLLVPADSSYFKDDDWKIVENFIENTNPNRIIFSGDYAQKWFSLLKNNSRATVKQEIAQQKIFD